MKKLTILLAGLGMAAAALPSVASAAPWTSISQRQANLSQRIDQGIRSGALNRNEAYRLKSQLRDVVGLEYRYARSGGRIDMRERADLDRRYDAISAKVRFEKHDRDYGRGQGRDHRR
jgi:hypothetical protein